MNEIEKQTLNSYEAAKYLGVAPNTLAKFETEGKIRFIRIGRRKLYPRVMLDKFLRMEEI
jgi:excisionase family DNA binding protein